MFWIFTFSLVINFYFDIASVDLQGKVKIYVDWQKESQNFSADSYSYDNF